MARNKYPEQTIKRIMETSLRLFTEKGYDQTTIQDIIDTLGDLSKGAIYHHFKSKDDIMIAISCAMDKEFNRMADEIRSNKLLNGLQKLKEIIYISIRSQTQEDLLSAMPNILKNPRMLAEQIHNGNDFAAPMIQAFIEEGIADGSITATQPKYLSQVMVLVMNIWLNPLVFACTREELVEKFKYAQTLTVMLGIPVMDDEMMAVLDRYRTMAKQ